MPDLYFQPVGDFFSGRLFCVFRAEYGDAEKTGMSRMSRIRRYDEGTSSEQNKNKNLCKKRNRRQRK